MSRVSNGSQPRERARWSGHLSGDASTSALGARLAPFLSPGLHIYLRGELGSGKTTLVRGLLRALGVESGVKSPSYVLVELYVVSRLNLYHFDFYRFLDAEEFGDAGFADYFGGDAVCIVEWPEKAGKTIPLPDIEITLAYAEPGREVNVRAYTETGERCLNGLREA
jgi:tRNA threonylcarbamoyladenosine biosynthesis protein TsaE